MKRSIINRIFIVFMAAAAMMPAVSCTKEELSEKEETTGRVFTAKMPDNDDTRTAIGDDGRTIYWTLADNIQLMYYDDTEWSYCSTSVDSRSSDNKTATFTISSGYLLNKEMSWALYPYYCYSSLDNSYTYDSCTDDKITITINDWQRNGNFMDANIMASKVDGDNIPFQNVCGIFTIDCSDYTLSKIQTIRICGPGIAGDLDLCWNGSRFDVQRVGEGESQINVSSNSTREYVSIRPGTYPAGTISFWFYAKSGYFDNMVTYDKELTVTPGMIVNWGDLYKDRLDPEIAIIPNDFSSQIQTVAGDADDVYTIEFLANTPGDKADNETCINEDYSGPKIYASYLSNTVTVRTAASKLFKPTWSYAFYQFENLKNVVGIEDIDFRGVTDLSHMFLNTSIETFDFTKMNSTASLQNLSEMFQNAGISTYVDINMKGVDFSNVTDMSHMFRYSKVKEVDAEGAVFPKMTDFKELFRESKLEKVSFKNVDLSTVTDMSYMFKDCEKLVSVDLSGVTTRDLVNISNMFADCESLTSVDLSSFNTANVKRMDWMFSYCKKLTSVDISSFNTEKVTSFEDMFNTCWALKSLDLSNFSTPSATSFKEMFYLCTGLTSLSIPNFDTSSATSLSDMFAGCTKLTSLDLSHFNTEKVTTFESLFSGCSKLETLDISSFRTQAAKNFKRMFDSCSSLTELDLINFDTSKATDMSNMFSGTTKLALLSLGTKFSFISDDPFGTKLMGSENTASEYYTSIRCTSSTWSQIDSKMGTNIDHYEHLDLPMAEFPTAATHIKNFQKLGALAGGNDKIKTITFKAECDTEYSGEIVMNEGVGTFRIYGSVDASGNVIIRTPGPGFQLHSDSRWFFSQQSSKQAKYTALTTVDGMSLLHTGNVTKFDNFFLGCSSLETVDISRFSTANVTSFSSMFKDCSSINNLDFSSFSLESSSVSCASMFQNCSSLKNLDLSTFNANVSSANYMFDGCTVLGTLLLGKEFECTSDKVSCIIRNTGSANTTAYYTTISCGSAMKTRIEGSLTAEELAHYHFIINE